MTNYIKVTENNDYEGEIWNYYVPEDLEGITELKQLANEDESFSISDEIFTETQVNTLCKNSECGYHSVHNKVSSISFQDDNDPDATPEDLLYKGGCFSFVRKFA